MFVSIIVPYFKRKQLFINELDSLEANTYPKEMYEIILVEDGSNDFGKDSFDDYDSTIIYINSERSQDSPERNPPRNLGIKKAKGDLLIFLDCDQIVRSDFIEQHVNFHIKRKFPVLQIGTRRNLIANQNVKNLAEAVFDEDCRKVIYRDYQSNGESILGMWGLVWTHNVSVLKKYVNQFGDFDNRFIHWGLEDVEFGLRMSRGGLTIINNPQVEVYHQYHPQAVGRKVYEGWIANYHILIDKYFGQLDVQAVKLMADIIDPKLSFHLDRTKINEASALHFKRFEMVLRCLSNNKLEHSDIEMFTDDRYVR